LIVQNLSKRKEKEKEIKTNKTLKNPFKNNLKKKGGGRGLVWMSMINLQLAETASSRKQAVHDLEDIESIAPLSCIPPGRLARSFYPVSSHMKILLCPLDLESCSSSSSEIDAFKDKKTRSRVLQQQL